MIDTWAKIAEECPLNGDELGFGNVTIQETYRGQPQLGSNPREVDLT